MISSILVATIGIIIPIPTSSSVPTISVIPSSIIIPVVGITIVIASIIKGRRRRRILGPYIDRDQARKQEDGFLHTDQFEASPRPGTSPNSISKGLPI
jgi:hypothetical protein